MTDRELLHWAWEELEDLADVGYGSKTLLEALRDRVAQPVPQKKEWVGLTDDEIKEIIGPWGETPIKGYTRKLFDQIEAKLKEKNSA